MQERMDGGRTDASPVNRETVVCLTDEGDRCGPQEEITTETTRTTMEIIMTRERVVSDGWPLFWGTFPCNLIPDSADQMVP